MAHCLLHYHHQLQPPPLSFSSFSGSLRNTDRRLSCLRSKFRRGRRPCEFRVGRVGDAKRILNCSIAENQAWETRERIMYGIWKEGQTALILYFGLHILTWETIAASGTR